jgi:hypothetical protein
MHLMRFLKDQPRRDRLKGNANPLLRRRVAAGLTQDNAMALYRAKIGPVSRRTWQYWEKKKKNSDIPPGAFLIF